MAVDRNRMARIQSMKPDLLTVTEAARRLGVSRQTVDKRVRLGSIPSVRIDAGGGKLRYVLDRGVVELLRRKRLTNG